ncbi:MAG: hypothetical protein UY99_C0007G0014 [Parcubacteria group bacterium GW2011_GWA1_59_11]|nr:MAG: hypothetical protein UY99_C0007G0014 [Parcubacteria group bacterium GW2011_GWA1_59_11]
MNQVLTYEEIDSSLIKRKGNYSLDNAELVQFLIGNFISRQNEEPESAFSLSSQITFEQDAFQIWNIAGATPILEEVILEKTQEAESFLRERPEMVKAANFIFSAAKRRFDKGKFRLEVVNDPESDESSLFLSITTDKSAEEAYSCLDRVYDEVVQCDSSPGITLNFDV